MKKVTFCIPSKNNLRYLKTCIPSIRRNAYRKDHDIIVFVDSDEDGTLKWLEENRKQYNLDYYVNPNLGKTLYGIGKAYDFCIEKSKTDIFMVFHADMMLGIDADLHAYNELSSKKNVVCSTRIEPPLHPNGGEKIIEDFGIWPEEFKEEEFNEYVKWTIVENKGKTTTGIFAPWMMYKEEFLKIGGHDPVFHSAREDSDVFNRLQLAGFEFIQSWESLVYHLTGRGGQFQHGTVTQDEQQKSEVWKQLMANSTKEFIRKWGTMVLHDRFMKPIIPPKFNIGIRVLKANLELVRLLEPWCDKIYLDDEMGVLTSYYFEEEHKNTSYDLSKRIYTLQTTPDTEILVEVNKDTFTQQDYLVVQQLPQILESQGHQGVFEIGNLVINITELNQYQDRLIHV